MKSYYISSTYSRQHKRLRQITKEINIKNWQRTVLLLLKFCESISQVQRCKRRKTEGEDEFQRGKKEGGGSDRWVGRATGGRYRERQEAGQRDRPTEKEAQQREERGRQSSSVSIVSVAASFQPVKFPSWRDSTVWRKILEWWTAKINLTHSGLSPVDTTPPLGIEIAKALQGRKALQQT